MQEGIIENILTTYKTKTPTSRNLWEKAYKLLPSGSSRTSIFYPPYPAYASRGSADIITDADGNERIDYCYNFTSLILGHKHPAVMNAVRDQIESGTVFGAPTELEIDHAAELNRRMPSLEKVRYTVTGTEADMFAIRLARAYSGRRKIAKFEGGYHGTSEFACVSVHPHISDATDNTWTPSADTLGLSPEHLENMIILPFNNLEVVDVTVRKNAKDLACIIMEPIMRGITPKPGFLRFMRELADELEIVLIFDEVITGFRVSAGGAQEYYHVRPDLTTMGKVIGGGFPVGAVGGTDEIMSLMAHESLSFPTPTGPKVPHAGTFNAHPITLAAGLATLRELTFSAYEKLNTTGAKLREGLAAASHSKSVNAKVTGITSLFNIEFTKNEIVDYRTSATANAVLRRCLDLDLLNRGVYFPPSHFGCVSTVSTQEHIDETIEIVSASLETLKPLIGNPELSGS